MIGDIFCLNATIFDDSAVEVDENFIVSIHTQGTNRVGVMSNYSASNVTIIEDAMDCKLKHLIIFDLHSPLFAHHENLKNPFCCIKMCINVAGWKLLFTSKLSYYELDVKIGFEQAEYAVKDWINSSLMICVKLTSGLLERNVTVTVYTEKSLYTEGMQFFSTKYHNFNLKCSLLQLFLV